MSVVIDELKNDYLERTLMDFKGAGLLVFPVAQQGISARIYMPNFGDLIGEPGFSRDMSFREVIQEYDSKNKGSVSEILEANPERTDLVEALIKNNLVIPGVGVFSTYCAFYMNSEGSCVFEAGLTQSSIGSYEAETGEKLMVPRVLHSTRSDEFNHGFLGAYIRKPVEPHFFYSEGYD